MAKEKEETRQKPPWLVKAEAARYGDRPNRTAVKLSDDAVRRLRAAKAYEGVDFSQIVEGLICEYVMGYTVSLRVGKGEAKDEAA